MKPTVVLLAVATLVAPALFPDEHREPRDEARILANEVAATALLKSGIFPAEIQFQGGGYLDEDGDNVGEYGFLSELSGRTATSRTEAGALRLIVGDLATADTANGYRFAVYLPDGDDAIADGDIPAPRTGGAAADVDARERFFMAYAWPATVADGDLVFMLCHDGQVRSHPYDGRAPEWRAALAPGERFGGKPAWPVFEPTDEMRAAQEAQDLRKNLERRIVEIAQVAIEIRVVSGLWTLDCDRIARMRRGQRPQRGAAVPPPALGFTYVRPREPLQRDQPLLVSDPELDDEHRVRVVFASGDADAGFTTRVARLDADASGRVWAAAQAIAAKPETRATGSLPEDWDAVRDDVTAAAAAAVPQR